LKSTGFIFYLPLGASTFKSECTPTVSWNNVDTLGWVCISDTDMYITSEKEQMHSAIVSPKAVKWKKEGVAKNLYALLLMVV
jgi:hypothetical protein